MSQWPGNAWARGPVESRLRASHYRYREVPRLCRAKANARSCIDLAGGLPAACQHGDLAADSEPIADRL